MNYVLQLIISQSKSCEEADFLPTIFGEFRHEAVMGAVPVVLFGAGSAGKELYPILQWHGVNPVCFCDSNPLREGELYCGLPIISLADLRQKHTNSLIVVTSGAYGDQIKQQLVDAGFNAERVLIISNSEAICYYTHLAQWHWSDEDLLAHADDLQKVYSLLADDKSRDIFVTRIALFVRGADFQSYRDFISKLSDARNVQGMNDSEAYLQFNNDLIRLADDELFVDGGAFTGDSTLEFIKAVKKQQATYCKIICFEPDTRIFAELQRSTTQINNILLRPFGLWSHATTLSFADSNILKPGSTRIVSENDSNEDLSDKRSEVLKIPTTCIDEELPSAQVTLIKMDIEGAEIEALNGARKTIARCNPRLIISAYHRRNDLFEIPLLIHEMMPTCKLYFRHFSNNFGETTLFAIP
ncbi:MAG: FkbM family methyltransferase [Desulfuromonadales bacterium]|nr:FkbM family methyltransferase [Desulfuromonadales bacterium]